MSDSTGMSNSAGMSEPTGMSDSATEPEEIPTRFGYQCRFPVGVMKNILSFLASEVLDSVDQDKDNGSTADDSMTRFLEDRHASAVKQAPISALRAVQQTSSAIYGVATPFLYRYLRVTSPQIMSLLRLFCGIEEIQEVILLDRNNHIHPLDLHLYHRLRLALSFVQELDLTIYSNRDMSAGWLIDYIELCTVLRRLNLPHLWPALDKVSIRVRDGCGQKTSDPDSYACFPYDNAMIRAIGSTLLPTYLHIELPDPPSNKHFKADLTGRSSSLYSMRADHVTVSNITDSCQGSPFARLSLTLGFSARCGKLARGFSSNLSEALSQRLFNLECMLPHVQRLTLIGVDRGLEALPVNRIRREVARALFEFGLCHDESLYRIRPWGSPEEGDWDVWHSYKEPFGEHFFRSDTEGAVDNSDDDSDSEAAIFPDEDYAQATYEVIQEDIKAGIRAIDAKAISAGRRIDSMVKRMSTTDRNLVEMKGSQIAMVKNMAKIVSAMKQIASKGNKGNSKSRIRRYQGKRTSKKAEKKAEEEDAGWIDEK